MFVKYSHPMKKAIFIVYIDGIIVTQDNIEEIHNLKIFLATEFEIKDLKNIKYFLGMEIVRSKLEISVSQWKHVLDLLKSIKILGCKPADTPMNFSSKVGDTDNGALLLIMWDIKDSLENLSTYHTLEKTSTLLIL